MASATQPKRHVMVGLGEVLWDLLPTGKQLGGAPANFAFHAAQLRHEGVVASRIGSDALGREVLDRLRGLGLGVESVQTDEQRATGTVNVKLDGAGQPQYTIVENVAWDWIEWNGTLERLAKQADVVCFGSLAQRCAASRESIARFLDSVRPEAIRIFDLNLRQDFFDRELIESGLKRARIAKMNDEELRRIAEMLGIPGAGEKEKARELLSRHNLDLVCVTRGARGSLLVTRDYFSAHPGIAVKVADSIGSGDAFVAAVAHHFLKGSPIEQMNEAANQLGAFVASRSGATPTIDPKILARFV